MITIKASEFKAKCLSLMDKVALTGEPIAITKNGKLLAKLEPYSQKPESIIGALKTQITITGDSMAGIPESDWSFGDENDIA